MQFGDQGCSQPLAIVGLVEPGTKFVYFFFLLTLQAPSQINEILCQFPGRKNSLNTYVAYWLDMYA